MFVPIKSLCVATACWVGLAAAAHAEPIPQRYIDNDHAACLKSCGEEGAPESFCKAHCDCSMKEISRSVTLEDYLSLVAAMSQKKDPPKSVMNHMTQIAMDCAIEAKKGL